MLPLTQFRLLVDAAYSGAIRLHAAAHNETLRREDRRDTGGYVLPGTGAGWGLPAHATRRRQAMASVVNGLAMAVEGLTRALFGIDALVEIEAEEAPAAPKEAA